MRTREEIEALTDRALDSLNGLQPAEANPYLYQKIRHRLEMARQDPATARHMRLLFRFTMALLLFVCINVVTVVVLHKDQAPAKGAKTGIAAVSAEFFGQDSSYNY